jgi:hypothetical protein
MKSDDEFRAHAYSPFWVYRRAGETNLRFREILHYFAENCLLIDDNAGLRIMDIGQKGP